jgi:CO/xanthine dehydrogenase FAD-binding subunit
VTPTFTSAATLDDALSAIAGGARPVAGGTDLVVGARQGKAPLPDTIVAIDRIDGLRALEVSGGGLRLGTLVTHGDIVASERIRTGFSALADASAIVGSHATRAQGTIGGNVMNASPAMDTGGPLLCFGAVAVLRSGSGERSVALDELWTAPGKTSAAPDELLVALELPAPTPGTGSCYVRLEYRRQMEIAVVGATGVLTVDAIAAAAAAAAAASTPISDVRASADYRRAMAEVMAARAITAALARARGDDVPIPASPALHGAP